MSSTPASRNGSGPSSRPRAVERYVALAYILAVAMPPLGFVMGLGLGVRTRSRHWPWVVALSIGSAVVWAVIIGAGGLSTSNQGY